MDRDSARKAAEVMLAYADGKEIEWYDKLRKEWCDCHCPNFDWGMNTDFAYRIKPTPTYRPFTNAEECWEEMRKHEPFGWVKGKIVDCPALITFVTDEIVMIGGKGYGLEIMVGDYTFPDGTPFGKLTEEG